MKEISLHILDLAENSINAGANTIIIEVTEHINNDELIVTIADNGCGMDAEKVRCITDPFVTSRTGRRVGLGIPFFKAAAEACNGSFHIKSDVGQGTRVSVRFCHSHIDRMPLGDLKVTFLNLLVGAPQVHWIFRYVYNENLFEFDDQPVKAALQGLPLSDPQVLKFLRSTISEGIDRAKGINQPLSFQERK